MTDPQNNRTEYTYNARQQVLTHEGRAWTRSRMNTYDPSTGTSLSTRVTRSPTGPADETTYTYDATGNVEDADDARGRRAARHAVRVRHAPATCTQETDALGHDTSYTYDANGNRLTQTTTRGHLRRPVHARRSADHEYVYDRAGRLLRDARTRTARRRARSTTSWGGRRRRTTSSAIRPATTYDADGPADAGRRIRTSPSRSRRTTPRGGG